MSKQLYEEALADVKQLKQIAEDNAKREIIEAVTPRIRELIENQLLNEGSDDDHDYDGKLLIDRGEEAEQEASALPPAIMPGEVAAEFDVKSLDDDQEFSVDDDVLDDMSKLSVVQVESVELEIHRTYDEIARKIKTDNLKSSNLPGLKLKVESLYNSLQKLNADGSKVESLGEKLEECFAVLEFANGAMENNMKKKLNEGDVTLVLHNMPDDLNLDDVTVDLVAKESSEEEPVAEEPAEASAEGEEGSEAEETEEKEESGEEEKKVAAEGKDMEFDPIVEIDEKELREAIKSMRALSESKEEDLDEYALTEEEDDDDLLELTSEGEVEEVAVEEKKEPCATCEGKGCDECGMTEGYGDDDLDEVKAKAEEEVEEEKVEEGEEEEDLAEFGGKRENSPSLPGSVARLDVLQPNVQGSSVGMAEAKAAGPKPKHNAMGAANLKKPLGTDGKEAKDKDWYMKDGKKVPAGKTVEKMKGKAGKSPTVPASVSMKPVKESNENGASEIDSLRAQLAEVNLFNAKLLYTNKLLQNEALTARQKAQIIEQLDEANSLREVKLVYESLQKTLATKAPIRESADRVVGTSSRPTSSGGTSSVLSESVEASRWARLAGIK